MGQLQHINFITDFEQIKLKIFKYRVSKGIYNRHDYAWSLKLKFYAIIIASVCYDYIIIRLLCYVCDTSMHLGFQQFQFHVTIQNVWIWILDRLLEMQITWLQTLPLALDDKYSIMWLNTCHIFVIW